MLPPTPRALRPGLLLLEAEVERFDVRSVLLLGTSRVVVWDTLAHPRQMEPVRDLVGGLPRVVVYSHADWDHAWGTCGLVGVEEVVAHEAALARFGGDVSEELARRQASDAAAWGAVRLVPPTRTFTDGFTMDLGGLTLELYALPGHTPDSIVGLVPEWGVLLAGDAVETPLPFVNDADAVDGWVASLERWSGDERVKIVVPSHGSVGGSESIERTAAYLRDLGRGREPAEADDLTPFYRETHEANLLLVRAAGR